VISAVAQLQPDVSDSQTVVLDVSATPVLNVSVAPVLDVSAAPVLDVSAAPVLDVSVAPVLDVSAAPVLDVSAAPVLDVSAAPLQDVSAAPVLEIPEEDVCPIDLSGTDILIQKIDKILDEIPVTPVESAIAKLWIPSYTPGVVQGSPMSRATQRG
jgi:hypothetical protein